MSRSVDGGRQQVAVEGRTQEGLAEAYREVLTPLLQRGLLQAGQGIRVGGVLKRSFNCM